MFKTSLNVIFVYSLLVVDLLVNITDNLLQPSNLNLKNNSDISLSSFIIVLIQIIAIICVIIDLVLHFFQASDQVRQCAWFQKCRDAKGAQNRNYRGNNDQCPMPQREALKLVLDKYWWSLVVGCLYLVLTIVLQIYRLDLNLHDRLTSSEADIRDEVTSTKAFITNEPASILDSHLLTKGDIYHSLVSEKITNPIEAEGISSGGTGDDKRGPRQRCLLPIIVLLIHKLMSTCYYVSFVVVYRASPSQMVNRILVGNKNYHHQAKRPVQ